MSSNPYHDIPDEVYEQLVHAEHAAPAASTGNGACITVASTDGYISFQDSKLDDNDRQARTQIYTPAELAAFVADAKAGRYDHLI
ncbi:protein of unknown function [Actinopolyspora xinjiangensis]|uniref:DUF397 domain-containing protein n=2 Tax=Actinopolyspora TaxID=1849 RepID=A0A1I2CGW7_9ACTN|nr:MULTISPECIES: DUF397 domain-containing protein [Actinopolyspora]SDP96417.1 protein of unknown function [Actinopolyspora xinjiangensis]SFE67561.1 protein of unknown function [Actinopolyspora alba]